MRAQARGFFPLLAAIAFAAVLAAPAAAHPPTPSAEDVYPSDVTPPMGTQYPCALTPLPRALPGIPEPERAYVNRTYARILRAIHAKLVLLKALEQARGIEPALASYQQRTEAIVERIRGESPPMGLGPFQDDVVQALALQQAFFRQAASRRAAGASMAEIYAIPEGRQASPRLIAAFGRMSARYPSWTAQTRDSIYHHLCALDLF